ncbi:MAG: tetratricopeptide repeat protein [Deltaproteobacteria bacterium]
MSNPIIRTEKQQRITKILTGLVIGGSLIGATAIMLATAPDGTTVAEIEEAPKTELAWRQDFEPLPVAEAPVAEPEPIQIEEQLVEAEQPVVAIAHEEPERNFEEEAQELMVAGDLKGAYENLRKHVYSDAPTPDALHHIGQLGRELGDFAVAEQALMDAAALDPTRADISTELARVRLEAGDLEEARLAVREAIRTAPRDAEAWNVAGRIAMAQSEFHRAADAFEASLDLDPTHPIVHNNAGLNFLYMKRGPEAVDALETAVDLYEDRAPHFVFNNLGLAHELAGNYEEAREAFEEALLISPFYARAKVNLKRVEVTIASIEEKRSYETAKGVSVEDLDIVHEMDLEEAPAAAETIEIADEFPEPTMP